MKELDVVRITQDYENIPSGAEGTIVCEYDGIDKIEIDYSKDKK